MGLDEIRKKTQELQKAKLKEQYEEKKAKSASDIYEESPHSNTVPAVRNHYNNVKPFNQDLYSKKDADELYKYSKFSVKNRNISTPADISGKRPGETSEFEKVNLQDRQRTLEKGTSGRTEVAESMNYKHVWVRKKDDFDRDFRLLGKGGDFSEVRYKVPEEKIIDFEVRGPAAGRAIIREQADRLIMEEAMRASETEKEKKDREKAEKAEERRKRREKKNEDWRTNQDPNTRGDLDFLTEIQDWKQSGRYRRATKEELEAKERDYPAHVGPKWNTIDYEHVDQVLEAKAKFENLSVRQQLDARVVRDEEWEEYKPDLTTNRYFQGVYDDQLASYRKEKRDQVVEATTMKYAETASDLVKKRDQLIKEGYDIPGADPNKISKKLAGVGFRKNLWKHFKRIVTRQRAAFVKKMKDKFHNAKYGKRELTKAEKAMVMKESEALIDAADQGNRKLVKVALRFFADVDHTRGGRTALQMIFVRLCWIDAGLEVEPTWQPGYKGWHKADYDGCIKSLLNAGADINAIEGPNTDGFSIVHHAARLGCYDRVKYFLENGGKVDITTPTGETALHQACMGGHLDVIMLLIYTKHDIFAKNLNGNTMLHFAAMTGNIHIINFLLEAGADKRAKDNDGMTPLDVAMERKFMLCVEKLQKFKLPKADMGHLIQFWKSIQEDIRPESRSLFASGRNPSRSSRLTRFSTNRTRFVSKDKFRGTTFHQRGGKDVNRIERARQKQKEKETREREKFLEDNPPPENALAYIENLMKGGEKLKSFVPSSYISTSPKKKKKKKKKKKNTKNEEEEEEVDGAQEEGQEEVEALLKEVEDEAGVNILGEEEERSNQVDGEGKEAEGAGEKDDGESKKQMTSRFSAIFSPIAKMRGNNSVALQNSIRDSVKFEFFGKIAQTLSPFKKKMKAEEAKAMEEKAKDSLPELRSPPQDKVSPEFNLDLSNIGDKDGASENSTVKAQLMEEGAENGVKPKKKKRKKKKNRDAPAA